MAVHTTTTTELVRPLDPKKEPEKVTRTSTEVVPDAQPGAPAAITTSQVKDSAF